VGLKRQEIKIQFLNLFLVLMVATKKYLCIKRLNILMSEGLTLVQIPAKQVK